MLQKGTVPCPKCGSVAEACVRYFGDDIGGGEIGPIPVRIRWCHNADCGYETQKAERKKKSKSQCQPHQSRTSGGYSSSGPTQRCPGG